MTIQNKRILSARKKGIETLSISEYFYVGYFIEECYFDNDNICIPSSAVFSLNGEDLKSFYKELDKNE